MLDFDKYSITSVDSIVGFDLATKECLFILDELQEATLEGDAEVIWATGREGRRLSSMKRNKTFTITATNGLIVGGLMAQQLGDRERVSDTTNATIRIPAFERIPVGSGNTVETQFTAVGSVGNEIGWIYRANRDGSQGQKFAQAATASATAFAYDPATRTISLPTGGAFAEGDMVIVFYEYMTMGRRYANKSDSYAGDAYLVCDIIVKDVCDATLQHSKLVIPRVSMSDNFNLSFGADMAVQAFSAEAVASICAGEAEYFYWVFPQQA